MRDYLSIRTHLLLRRDGLQGVSTYSDYKPVDGVMVPHRWVVTTPNTGEQIIQVKRVRFDVPIAASTFAPREP